jgi:hypothetical protein
MIKEAGQPILVAQAVTDIVCDLRLSGDAPWRQKAAYVECCRAGVRLNILGDGSCAAAARREVCGRQSLYSGFAWLLLKEAKDIANLSATRDTGCRYMHIQKSHFEIFFAILPK